MKTIIKIWLAATVLLLMVGTAAAGITITATPIDSQVAPGGTATYEVNVSYFLPLPPTEHVNLSIDNPIWSSYSFVPNDYDIINGTYVLSTLSIDVPTTASQGTYNHIINATATGQIGPITITEIVTTDVDTSVIPEFTTIAIPVAATLGLLLLIRRRKQN